MKVAVLAVQGAFIEHGKSIRKTWCGDSRA